METSRRPSAATIAAVALGLAVFALDILWLDRFRFGYLTEWDESGYLAIGLADVHALRGGGPFDLIDVVLAQNVQAPLVPLSSVAFDLLLGDGVDAGLVTEAAFHGVLVLATYGLARRLVSPWWAVLAALAAGSIPLAIDYARIFHFAVPAAAFMTASLWALLRADGLTRRRWAVATGVLLGLTVLARTMTVAYMPGIVVAAALPVLAAVDRRRERLLNLAVLGVTAVAVAALWYLPNIRSVGHYLLHYGYGVESTSYGAERSIASAGYWTRELRFLVGDLYLPLAIVTLICVVAGVAAGAARPPGRERLGTWLSGPVAPLLVVVLGGYLALTSSRNEGTAFALPWIPALLVLAIAAAASVRPRAIRVGMVVALMAVAALNMVSKSGRVGALAGPDAVDVPGIGAVATVDATGIIQREVQGAGYKVADPAQPLPDLHRRWLPFAERVASDAGDYAAAREHRPLLAVGLDDLLLSNTRFALGGELALGEQFQTQYLRPFPHGDTPTAYRAQLRASGADLLITGQRRRGQGLGATVTRSRVERAAADLDFEPVRHYVTPDGRRVTLWYRDAEPPASLFD